MIQYDIHIGGCMACIIGFQPFPEKQNLRLSVMGDVAQAAPAAEGEVIEQI